ncbi:5'-3' exoribonuclease 4 [Nematocida major]|uniref:5'-3' exoribonuclease 4 n=1 Tax=Nematocida major TaxID=1912982 RepID=UPI002007F772|nr:5'-3' exoribonuclease 4 [Nematocida major]KAH9385879.1 5'-3' exoribonuclease 4 [Nematocida major]
MGVPSLFRWIAKRYPKSIYPATGQEIDNLYLDLNGIIHPCCHPRNKPAPPTEEAMFREIYRTIDHLVAISRPKQLLYIAVDGVAPRAKMNQQRERRFKPKEDAENCGDFDPNVITPGTPFMQRLHKSLQEYVESRMSEGRNGWKSLAVIYSGCDVPGEGEHKVYDFIRTIKGTGVRHAICGLDADLIFLSLATHEKSFRILREDVFFLEREERSSCKNCRKEGHSTGNCEMQNPPYIYLDVDMIRRYLYSDFSRAVNARFDFNRLLDDWIFLCFFVGNDFLPSIPSMDIKVSAIETLTNSYIENVITRREYITDECRINIPELEVLMNTLAECEDKLLRAKLAGYLKNAKRRGEVPREEDTRIKLYEKKGRAEYYAEKLHARTPEEIQSVCFEYVRGLAWILQYYHSGVPSWDWFYPYHFAPLAGDVSQALKSLRSEYSAFEKGMARSPLEQVMAILPPSSSACIPKGLHRIFEELKENYPETVRIDMFGKTQAWQGVAVMPFFDCDSLVDRVRRYSGDLTVEEIERNVLGENIIFLPEGNKNYSLLESVYVNFSKASGMKIQGKFYSGRATTFSKGRMPGEKGVLQEEKRNYTVKSLSAVFTSMRKVAQ